MLFLLTMYKYMYIVFILQCQKVQNYKIYLKSAEATIVPIVFVVCPLVTFTLYWYRFLRFALTGIRYQETVMCTLLYHTNKICFLSHRIIRNL